MKKSRKSMLGVTLLEIMLVLAIAAMVIVMSIRYYQSASTNQKINAALNTVTGMVAAGESFLAAYGSFTGISAGNANFLQYLPNSTIPNSPWGGPISSLNASGPTGYSFSMNVPTDVCPQLLALVRQNGKMASSSCGSGSITIVVNE